MRISPRTFTKAALVLAFAAAPLAANAQTVRYRVVPLPEVGTPHVVCVPTAINERGDVVGYCAAGGLQEFAVVWRAGTATDVGTLPGGTFARAWAINATGDIVGEGDDGDVIPKAIAYRTGSWMEIDGSGGSLQNAYGITAAGVVFGNFTTTGSPGTEDWDPVYWTFDSDAQKYVRNDLPKAPGDLFSGAFVYAASPTGIAVGQVATNTVGNRAGLWMDDAAHSLVVLGVPPEFGAAALAFGVSGDGRAAGYAATGLSETAVLWLNDAVHTVVNIGRLPGDALSRAYGVNNAGRVVGVSYPGLQTIGRGFVYQEGALTALSDLLDPSSSGWTINEAVGINNAGQIVATGTLNGVRQPVLLEPVEAAPVITALTLNASHLAPQPIGTAITFTAAAEGGTSPYQFKWLLSDGSAPSTLQDWSAAASFEWTPAAANAAYEVIVWARSAGNDADAPEKSASKAFSIVAVVTGLTLTSNPGSPQVAGTSVEFTAVASGADAEFQWLVSDGSVKAMVQDWSTVATFTWSPAAAGAYEVFVAARRVGASTAEAEVSMPFAILRRVITTLSLSADQPSPQFAGTGIGLSAQASGGTEPYQYKFSVSDGTTESLLQDWGGQTVQWTPATPNTYTLIVQARGAGNTTGDPEATATRSFAIERRVISSVAVSADNTSPQPVGTTITFVATATGGTAPYEFTWRVSDGTTTAWSAAADFVWTPTVANSYVVTVWARGAGNTADSPEAAFELTFVINPVVEPPPTVPHDNRDGLKPLPGKRLGKGAPDYSRGHRP